LAAAREESVLAAWSGLGYYRRARMLHAAAKVIAKEHSGKLPGTREGLRELPGIGRYTAAAVASIAFDEPVAVVDGNVERVLQRVGGPALGGEGLWQAAEILLDRANPGDFNQAMMELGAIICLPAQPECRACPVRSLCATRGAYPARKKLARHRKREITLALACRKGSVLLVQRSRSNPIMPGMWELPEFPNKQAGEALLVLRHSITVTDYKVRVVKAVFPHQIAGKWIANKRLSQLPLTGLTKKILRAMKMV
jgi:A/G-specific adenine glycosylase